MRRPHTVQPGVVSMAIAHTARSTLEMSCSTYTSFERACTKRGIIMRKTLLASAVVAMAVGLSGCFPLDLPTGAAPLRYRDVLFGVTKTSDITYGSAVNIAGQTVTLKLDEYAPTGDSATGRPAVVWVHGGSFSSGSKTSPELV